MRRSYGLSGPISCARPLSRAFSREERRHLLQLDILALAVALAVDHDAAALVAFLAEHGSDDVLERRERLALPPYQQPAVVAHQIDAQSVRHLFCLSLELKPHRGHDFLDELADLCWCGHKRGLVLSRIYVL